MKIKYYVKEGGWTIPTETDLPVEEFFNELKALYEKYQVFIEPPCAHDGLIIRALESGDIENLREIEFLQSAVEKFKK